MRPYVRIVIVFICLILAETKVKEWFAVEFRSKESVI